MSRVKAWVNYSEIPAAKPDGDDQIYVEEIPASAIRVEAVVKTYTSMSGYILGCIDVPDVLIGKKVEIIIMECD